jgi:6-phospho-3-hexuloisomerase
MTAREQLDAVLAEMRDVFSRMDENAVPSFAGEIQAARRIFVHGAGRNGLVLQAFAMRLMHLGLDGHYVGQLSAPPIGPGDVFVTAMALGKLPTADALARTARDQVARVLVISARPESVVGADVVIDLPAQTMADPMTSVLALGSPFELALSLFCDLTVAELMSRLRLSNYELAARHTNLL